MDQNYLWKGEIMKFTQDMIDDGTKLITHDLSEANKIFNSNHSRLIIDEGRTQLIDFNNKLIEHLSHNTKYQFSYDGELNEYALRCIKAKGYKIKSKEVIKIAKDESVYIGDTYIIKFK
jgi:hypothetical protein